MRLDSNECLKPSVALFKNWASGVSYERIHTFVLFPAVFKETAVHLFPILEWDNPIFGIVSGLR